KKYRQHVQTMFQLVGCSPQEADAKAANVLNLETKLAESMLTEVEKRNPMAIFHKRSISQLSEMTPSLNWEDYLRAQGVKEIDTLVVFELDHMETVGKILSGEKLGNLKTF